MLNDWVTWMKSNGFKGNNGNYISVISGYRTVETQEEIKNHAPNSSAIPGTSMHGWGIAVDLIFIIKMVS
jgi:LAS superfamily LD-carboxypeptidase LdcB